MLNNKDHDKLCERLYLKSGSSSNSSSENVEDNKEKSYYGSTVDIDKKNDDYTDNYNGFLLMKSAQDIKEALLKKNKLLLKMIGFVTILILMLLFVNKNKHDNFKIPLKVNNEGPKPFSTKSPMELNIPMYDARSTETRPSVLTFGPQLSKGAFKSQTPLPTNSWYQNVLALRHEKDLSQNHRLYSIPYILDFVGSIAGVRVHMPYILPSDTVVQLSYFHEHGLTLGRHVTKDNDRVYTLLHDESSDVSSFTPLGIHLQWKDSSSSNAYMTTPIVRGMPYTTMKYKGDIDPVIASEIALGSMPVIDGVKSLEFKCEDSMTYEVQHDMELFFKESGFTWLVFFSQPVIVQCKDEEQLVLSDGSPQRSKFELQVVSSLQEETDELVVRLALGNNCTTGMNPSFCYRGQKREAQEYIKLLKDHASYYPNDPEMNFHFPEEDAATTLSNQNMTLKFNWGSVDMSATRDNSDSSDKKKDLLMYALPHHLDMITTPNVLLNQHCTSTLHGSACLLKSNEWQLLEDMGDDIALSYVAPRVPHHSTIPELVKAVKKDIKYTLPDYYMRAAGDTYFSGKMLAKLGRILVIANELKQLASHDITSSKKLQKNDNDDEFLLTVEALKLQVDNLPTEKEMNQTIDRLRDGVQVWLSDYAESKFVYDAAYGGLVNCGCVFKTHEKKCDNVFPTCDSFSDPGLDFGHAYYNDHHFHQGYHVYAASIVASFDSNWGKEYFERVLLYIRDIANPSEDDIYFPMFRHKDWFLGNSWASGIATLGGQPYPNGRNQESSSEAISAYEGVALFGNIMADIWNQEHQKNESSTEIKENLDASLRVRSMGRLLTATELRAASRYYHVRQNSYKHKDNTTKTTAVAQIYPPQYKKNVVGMMWQTMVQFQTWFGATPFLVYGIQLMPLTSISEQNFDLEWLYELYPSFANSCKAHALCEEQGWSILQYAVLATIGHREKAFNQVLKLPNDVFLSAGGSGHSLTNTLWFIGTRKAWNASDVLIPLAPTSSVNGDASNCGCPDSCTLSALNNDAGGSTCKERMEWITKNTANSKEMACQLVGGVGYPSTCGACDPKSCKNKIIPPSKDKGEKEDVPEITCGCPETCVSNALDNDANGFSCKHRIGWLMEVQGHEELVACSQIGGLEYSTECASCDPDRCLPFSENTAVQRDEDGDCPPCTKEICRSTLNRCPVYTAPYLCFNGPNHGGCDAVPWKLNDPDSGSGLCFECCKLFDHCDI